MSNSCSWTWGRASFTFCAGVDPETEHRRIPGRMSASPRMPESRRTRSAWCVTRYGPAKSTALRRPALIEYVAAIMSTSPFLMSVSRCAEGVSRQVSSGRAQPFRSAMKSTTYRDTSVSSPVKVLSGVR